MDPIIVALAKAYARRIERGFTAPAATAYLAQHFPGATAEQRTQAIAQAQLAMAVGFNLAQLEPQDQLADALLGITPPSANVGVRVTIGRVGMGDVDRHGNPAPRLDTVFIPMQWSNTVADVLHAVEQYVQDHWMDSGPPQSVFFNFAGPTLWPLTP